MRTLLRAYRSDSDDREVNLIFDGPVTVTGNTDNDAFVMTMDTGAQPATWFRLAFMEMRGEDHVVLRGETMGVLGAIASLHNLSRWIACDCAGGVVDHYVGPVESET
jgi:hypothetical protein